MIFSYIFVGVVSFFDLIFLQIIVVVVCVRTCAMSSLLPISELDQILVRILFISYPCKCGDSFLFHFFYFYYQFFLSSFGVGKDHFFFFQDIFLKY